MTLPRWIIVVFAVVQVVGVLCVWLEWHVPSAIGVPMWFVSFFVLMPGNFLGPWIAEALLWNRDISHVGFGVIATLLTVAINAVVWFVLAKAVVAVVSGQRAVKGRRS